MRLRLTLAVDLNGRLKQKKSKLRVHTMSSTTNISRRAEENLATENLLWTGIRKFMSNPFHAETNKNGIINLGTAENKIMAEVMLDKLNSLSQPFTLDTLQYGNMYGSHPLRAAIAALITKGFHTVEPVEAEHVFVVNGAGSAVNNLTMVLCDEGEAVMIPAPFYGGFNPDAKNAARATIVPVPSSSEDPDSLPPVSAFRTALAKARSENITVRAIILCSPNNPTGRTVPRALLRSYIEFANEEGLHVVSDEVYGLSVYRDGSAEGLEPFESVLAIRDLPDPERTHVVWSFSKDFGMSGMRSAAIITRSTRVFNALKPLAPFTAIPRVIEEALTSMLTDEHFVTSYKAENSKRLSACYDYVTSLLQSNGIPFKPANAAFFVWIDLRRWTDAIVPASTDSVQPTGRAKELALFERLIDAGLYLAPGAAFESPESGWFRVVFAADRNVVGLAIERLVKVLKDVENAGL
ncbi:hypothetical protein HK104_001086 [Borealophlyctis nickersoniae]|nr:hypothetical protein HK104_001086 [Borealophlyctis nickersoniae]